MIIRHLDEAVSMLDLYDLGSESFFTSVDAARRYLANAFYGKGEDRDGTRVACIGHTHIDCAWRWTFRQSREKVQRSFSTVLELMRRYPEYKFMSSQPLLYKYLKEEAPDLYAAVKERVKEGRWEPEGAMWVEADCNLTSGESLVRQLVHGKRFFKEEFGVDSHVLWLPDVFGYSAAMPQILRKSGVDWFVTSKISWNDTNQIPYDTFAWYGIDGTPINTHFLTAQSKRRHGAPDCRTTYNAMAIPAVLSGSYDRYQNKTLTDESIITFGFGDGGGGPTVEHLEYLRRSGKGIFGVPRSEIKFAGEFLASLREKIKDDRRLPKWRGELYLEFHRGTYTSIAKNKRNNRKSELLYLDAEEMSVLSDKLTKKSFPKSELYAGWEEILNNQFHDVIPGSSIGPVYEQCDKDYQKILALGERARTESEDLIASRLKEGGYVVFNPHSFKGEGLLSVDGRTACVSAIPPKGYRLVSEDELCFANRVRIDGKTVETDRYRLAFDEHWQIGSIYDKRAYREVLCGAGNEIRLYADYPDRYDAWEWQAYSREKYTTLLDVASVERVSDGVREGIRITRPYRASSITQTVWFTDLGETIVFDTVADWHEHHVMVKAAFPVDINADKATYEIQFGTLERPTHFNTSWERAKFEVCAQKYADLSEGDYGVAILNDCKYGHDIHEGVIMLSLLKSPTDPWPDADQGRHEFTYALMPHTGSFAASSVQKEAYYLNYPMRAVRARGDASTIPESYSLVSLDRENVICETVKEAYDSDDTILRLYESKNAKCEVKVTFGFPVSRCALTDLLEREIATLEVKDNAVTLPIGAFEILTLKCRA